MRTNYRGDLIPQDTAEDNSSFETSTDQPLSQAEIDDLMYGEGRTVEERIALLRGLRADLAAREAGDVGDNDIEPLLAEIDDRISELGGEGSGERLVVFDDDPAAHRETLSPDSDELEDVEAADAASLDEEDEWLDAEDDEQG